MIRNPAGFKLALDRVMARGPQERRRPAMGADDKPAAWVLVSSGLGAEATQGGAWHVMPAVPSKEAKGSKDSRPDWPR